MENSRDTYSGMTPHCRETLVTSSQEIAAGFPSGVVDWPWYTDGVIDPVVTQHVQELGQRAARAHDAERGQAAVPYLQRSPEFKPGKQPIY